MSARLEHWLRNNTQTYRAVLNGVTTSTAAGVLVSIAGVANKKVKLRNVQIAKPTNAFTLTVARNDVAATTGTYTALVPINVANSTGSTYGGVVRQYTVTPTLGGTTSVIGVHTISTGLSIEPVLDERYGDRGDIRNPVLTGATQSFIFNHTLTAASTVTGFIEFTVEP